MTWSHINPLYLCSSSFFSRHESTIMNKNGDSILSLHVWPENQPARFFPRRKVVAAIFQFLNPHQAPILRQCRFQLLSLSQLFLVKSVSLFYQIPKRKGLTTEVMSILFFSFISMNRNNRVTNSRV